MPAETKRYRWSHPIEWLDDHITELVRSNSGPELIALCRTLATKLDGDQIQDLFQTEMSADGYFTPLKAERRRR